MPDHRLAKARSGYEGYVYQPVRPNPPVIFDCAQVAKTWRDHYEPIPPATVPLYELVFSSVSPEALAVVKKNQAMYQDAMNRFYTAQRKIASVR